MNRNRGLGILLGVMAAAMAAILIGASSPSTATERVWAEPQTQGHSIPTSLETVHYVTLKFTQSSFTLSISQHIKDSVNALTFTFPTTERFYNSVRVGEEISSKFKTASFLLSGNIGSRKVVVEDKFTREEPVYTVGN